jgi:hypothetical protein
MDISENRTDWLEIAEAISSFRQMYKLADHIMESPAASNEDRRAARRVVTALKDVIEQPIAEHNVLMRARKKFQAMVKALDAV